MDKEKTTEERQKERMRIYRKARKKAGRIIRAIDRVLDGETETTACMAEGVNKSWMRRFVRDDIAPRMEDAAVSDTVRVTLDDWICWQDQFLKQLTGEERYEPEGFDEVFGACLADACTEEEQEVARMRFVEGLTLRAIGGKTGRSCECVRQIETKILRKLRRPQYRLPLMYGKEYQKLAAEAKGAQAEYDRARMARIRECRREMETSAKGLQEKKESILKELEELGHAGGMQPMDALDEIPLSEMGLSVRAVNALAKRIVLTKNGRRWREEPVRTVGQLARLSGKELSMTNNIGKGTRKEIEEALYQQYGIRLA